MKIHLDSKKKKKNCISLREKPLAKGQTVIMRKKKKEKRKRKKQREPINGAFLQSQCLTVITRREKKDRK